MDGSAQSDARPTVDAPIGGSTGTPTSVSVGAGFACAAFTDGRVECWGENSQGQLGDGTATYSTKPVRATALTHGPVTAVSCGNEFTCVLLAPKGTVECWGLNASGQLGDGTTMNTKTPVAAMGLTGVKAIAARGLHTCALLADGTVSCWGMTTNASGGTSRVTVPTPVPGVTGATAIATGEDDACALLADATVACWGDGTSGALGNGSTTSSATPVPVPNVAGATAISAGESYACAVLGDGTVTCWGNDDAGTLGFRIDQLYSTTAVAVPGLTGATTIAAGYDHACALLANGTVSCWGDRFNGAVGDGRIEQSHASPSPVVQLSGVAQIDANGASSCAVLADSKAILCWGMNSFGQLGNGTTDSSGTPVMVQVL